MFLSKTSLWLQRKYKRARKSPLWLTIWPQVVYPEGYWISKNHSAENIETQAMRSYRKIPGEICDDRECVTLYTLRLVLWQAKLMSAREINKKHRSRLQIILRHHRVDISAPCSNLMHQPRWRYWHKQKTIGIASGNYKKWQWGDERARSKHTSYQDKGVCVCVPVRSQVAR